MAVKKEEDEEEREDEKRRKMEMRYEVANGQVGENVE